MEPTLSIERYKEIDKFLRDQFDKMKQSVPMAVDDSWETMQRGTEVMVQLDAPTLCRENDAAEIRDIASTCLYRAVRAMIAIFSPGATKDFLMKPPCIIRNLVIWKLFVGSGICALRLSINRMPLLIMP